MEPQGTPRVQTAEEEEPEKELGELGEAWRQAELIRRAKEEDGHQRAEDHFYRVLCAKGWGVDK